jgi:hypothetical protein
MAHFVKKSSELAHSKQITKVCQDSLCDTIPHFLLFYQTDCEKIQKKIN